MSHEKRRHRKNYNEPGDAHALTFSCYKGHQFLKAERTCQWLKEAIDVARAESLTVRKEGIRFTEGANARVVHLEVIPLPVAAERYFLVVFEDAAQAPSDVPAALTHQAPIAPDEERARLNARGLIDRVFDCTRPLARQIIIRRGCLGSSRGFQ